MWSVVLNQSILSSSAILRAKCWREWITVGTWKGQSEAQLGLSKACGNRPFPHVLFVFHVSVTFSWSIINCYFGQRVVSKRPMHCIYINRLVFWFLYRNIRYSLLIHMQEKHVRWLLWASGWQPWLHPWCVGSFSNSWKNLLQNQELLSVGHCPPATEPLYTAQHMPASSKGVAHSWCSNLDTGLMKQDTQDL